MFLSSLPVSVISLLLPLSFLLCLASYVSLSITPSYSVPLFLLFLSFLFLTTPSFSYVTPLSPYSFTLIFLFFVSFRYLPSLPLSHSLTHRTQSLSLSFYFISPLKLDSKVNLLSLASRSALLVSPLSLTSNKNSFGFYVLNILCLQYLGIDTYSPTYPQLELGHVHHHLGFYFLIMVFTRYVINGRIQAVGSKQRKSSAGWWRKETIWIPLHFQSLFFIF